MVKTKSSVFILPMIMGVPIKYFSGFTNVFIGTAINDGGSILETDKRIFLVFKTADLKEQYHTKKSGEVIENKDREIRFKRLNQFVYKRIIGKYTVFVFRPVEKFIDDFNKFKQGKYSQFSEGYKKIVNKFYPNYPRLNSIINPTEVDRVKLAKELEVKLPNNCEIFSAPELIQEEFNVSKFIQIE